jgi:hydrogenase nickel insertion protein HypA
MHESTLAYSVVRTVMEQAEKSAAVKVRSVTVELGEWSAFNSEQVKFWVKIGLENTIAHRAKIYFRKIKGVIRCAACGFEGECPRTQKENGHFRGPILQCPTCQSVEVEIIHGREAIIKNIIIEK